jgi:hypothetical protein
MQGLGHPGTVEVRDGAAGTSQTKTTCEAPTLLGIRDWVRRLTVHSFARSALIFNSVAALAFTLFTGPRYAATEAMAPPESPQREQLTLSTDSAMKPWTGDLDGMLDRRPSPMISLHVTVREPPSGT